MSEPPTKKLKQSSLLDCFDRISNNSNSNSGEQSTNVTTSSKATASEESKASVPVMTESNDSNNRHEVNEEDVTETARYSMSPDLFTDSGSSQFSQEDAGPSQPSSTPSKRLCLGTPISQLHRMSNCNTETPSLKASHNHTVMFKLPHKYSTTQPPVPYPSVYDYTKDKWDADHVRMPCSHHNEYPVHGKAVRRWNIVEKALLQDISNTVQLQDAILSYNTRYAKQWDFSALHRLFLEDYTADQNKHFFSKTLKFMVRLCLQLPHLCTQPIPMLQKGHNHSLTFSQQQIASLLANAFFCTFPRRNAHHRKSEYASYPSINFNDLFSGRMPRQMEKLKCILHYFTRISQKMPSGCVTFKRQCTTQMPDWLNSSKCLSRLHIATDGTIEDDGHGMLQVDFANKYIGGGVLGHGCVQEEIRFVICPEMIISKLFTQVLEKNESLVMTGCERFSNYAGYGSTFTWSSDHIDNTPKDIYGRLQTQVVAIDAMVVHDFSSQFKTWAVRRDLDKTAYCGFISCDATPNARPAVCTGNWGCGAFGGDKRLKALIQMMAATEAGRDVCYFTFGDTEVCQDIHDIHQTLANLHISDIMLYIQQYYHNVCLKSRGRPLINICEFITQCMTGFSDDTDDSSQEAQSLPSNNTANTPNTETSFSATERTFANRTQTDTQ